jgi:hypothetical protein
MLHKSPDFYHSIYHRLSGSIKNKGGKSDGQNTRKSSTIPQASGKVADIHNNTFMDFDIYLF